MNRIKEIVVEPNPVMVGSIFRIKVKVDRGIMRNLITENSRNLITEDGRNLVTEGIING